MPHLHLPAAHSDTDLALAADVAAAVGNEDLYVAWSHAEGPGLAPEVEALVRDERPANPFAEALNAIVQGLAALARALVGERGAAASAASSSPSGGRAPSRAQGSSNSTRHLPSSVCISARRARNDRPERPLKPVTARSVRPRAISSRAPAAGSVLPAFDFQITNPQPGSSRDQHEKPLRFSTMS